MKDIQFIEDNEVEDKITTITRQANDEDEDLDLNLEESEE